MPAPSIRKPTINESDNTERAYLFATVALAKNAKPKNIKHFFLSIQYAGHAYLGLTTYLSFDKD